MEFEMIRSILAKQMSIDEMMISQDTAIDNELGMTSMDMFGFMISLEKAFEISLDIDIFIKMVTVEDVVTYIQKRKIYRG